ncbi:unnamed protein product [Trichobilharzia szidati]|nr:unnamed protein product [Trichobilharzia szidati]
MGGSSSYLGEVSRFLDGQDFTGRQDPYANQNFRNGTSRDMTGYPMYGQDYGSQPQPMYNMDMNRRNNMDQNFRSGTPRDMTGYPMYGQDYGSQPQPIYNMDMNRRNNMDQNFRSGTPRDMTGYPMYGQDYGSQPQPIYNMDMNRRNNMDGGFGQNMGDYEVLTGNPGNNSLRHYTSHFGLTVIFGFLTAKQTLFSP